jgi:hypothetical protein
LEQTNIYFHSGGIPLDTGIANSSKSRYPDFSVKGETPSDSLGKPDFFRGNY